MAATGQEGGTQTTPAPVLASAPANGEEGGVAFCDGRYVPAAEAKISVHDWGFSRNDTTYDVVHVWREASSGSRTIWTASSARAASCASIRVSIVRRFARC